MPNLAPMSGWLSGDSRGTKLAGIDSGIGEIIARNKDIIVIKWLGHKYWQGLYMERAYAPTRIAVYRLEKRTDLRGREGTYCEGLIEWDVRKPKETA